MASGVTRVPRRARIGIALVVAGLGLQLVAAFAWSPGMFIVSAAAGVPLVVVGAIFAAVGLRGRGGAP